MGAGETLGASTPAPARVLRDAIAQPLVIEEHHVSIGSAVYTRHGNDPVILLRHADLAMYAAKRNGEAEVRAASQHVA